MSLRDTLNQRPLLVNAAAVLAIALAGWCLYRQLSHKVHLPDSVFYSHDDGATWYRESIKLDPPIMKEGKEAVLARVFVIDGQEKVGYLERFSPEAKKIIEQFKQSQKTDAAAKGPPADLGRFVGAQQSGRQYKRPGEAKWVSSRDRAAVEQICKVIDSAGQPAVPVDP